MKRAALLTALAFLALVGAVAWEYRRRPVYHATAQILIESPAPCEAVQVKIPEAITPLGHLEITHAWTLTGCRGDLDHLNEHELFAMRVSLASFVKQTNWGLLRMDNAMRRDVASRLNAMLGREAVTDVSPVGIRVAE